MIDSLNDGLADSNVMKKATIARSVKYSGRSVASDDSLSRDIYIDLANRLIGLASESSPEVKSNALEGLGTIVKHHFQVVKPNLPSLIEFASQELPQRMDLIEEIKIADMTQKIDKHAPVRRAAYSLLLNLYELGALNSDEVLKLVNHLAKGGLADTSNEIIILVMHVFAQLTKKSCVAVLTQLDVFLPVLEKKLTYNCKLNSELATNVVVAILRFVYWLDDAAEMQDNPDQAFSDFMKNQVMSNANARVHYEKIKDTARQAF